MALGKMRWSCKSLAHSTLDSVHLLVKNLQISVPISLSHRVPSVRKHEGNEEGDRGRGEMKLEPHSDPKSDIYWCKSVMRHKPLNLNLFTHLENGNKNTCHTMCCQNLKSLIRSRCSKDVSSAFLPRGDLCRGGWDVFPTPVPLFPCPAAAEV